MNKILLILLAVLVKFAFSNVVIDACKDNSKGFVSNNQDLIAIDKPDKPSDLANISISTIKDFKISSSLALSVIAISPTEEEQRSGVGKNIYLCKKEKTGLRYFFLLSLEILDQKFEGRCTTAVIKKIEFSSQKPVYFLELTDELNYIQANDFKQINRKITTAYIFALPENSNIEMLACNIPIKTIEKNENNEIETLNELTASISNGKLICKKASRIISEEQNKWVGSFDLNTTSLPDFAAALNTVYKSSLSLFKSGKKSEAAQTLLKAVGPKPWSIDKSNVGIFNDLGFFLEEAGQFQDAVTMLADVIAKFPDRTPAYLNLADAYAGLKNHDKAKENYKKYIDLMTRAGKQSKIPKRVIDAVGK